jgi:NAD(P)-dependent dehydrogenase (short-subunit alcohol dehydrogenase family)
MSGRSAREMSRHCNRYTVATGEYGFRLEWKIQRRGGESPVPTSRTSPRDPCEKQPMLAFASPESAGALVVFLCSDAAATMTGATISIDGVWTAQ